MDIKKKIIDDFGEEIYKNIEPSLVFLEYEDETLEKIRLDLVEELYSNRQQQKIIDELKASGMKTETQKSYLLDIFEGLVDYFNTTFSDEDLSPVKRGVITDNFKSIITALRNNYFRATVEIPIEVGENGILPTYAHSTDACMDLYAAEDVTIEPKQTYLIDTDIKIATPEGYCTLIYPRSSIGAKTPLRLPNSVGVIDSGYRNNVKVIYQNTDDTEPYKINKGDRIAQFMTLPVPMIELVEVDDINVYKSDRNGGIGSTGK